MSGWYHFTTTNTTTKNKKNGFNDAIKHRRSYFKMIDDNYNENRWSNIDNVINNNKWINGGGITQIPSRPSPMNAAYLN